MESWLPWLASEERILTDVLPDDSRIVLIALILLLETWFAYLTLVIDVPQPIQYLILVPAGSMLLAIIFDSRVAFYGTVVIAFLVAGIRGNDYAMALTSLVAGASGAYTVRDIRNRRQIFRSIVFIFLGYAVSIVALSFEQFESVSSVLMQLTLALANAVFSPAMARTPTPWSIEKLPLLTMPSSRLQPSCRVYWK